MRIATDVGGTFTDLVTMVDGPGADATLLTLECDSTPPNFERGVQDVL